MKKLVLGASIAAALTVGGIAMAGDDPFLWLEETRSEQAMAWVKQQNEATIAALQGDPLYATLLGEATQILTASDRIPYGLVRGEHVYNFWQDETHVRGLWRRTTIASYTTATPEWETVLDIDALAAAENENWVWNGTDCDAPAFTRCLVMLSRGGGDAVVIREFDVPTKSFVADGFSVAEAKTDATWFDADTLMIGTDFGEGSLTTSGYPRIVKLWKRGTPLADAKTIYEGPVSDIGSSGFVIDRPEGDVPLIVRSLDFFNAENYAVAPDGSTRLIPIPVFAQVQGVVQGQMLLTLRDTWEYDGQAYGQGSLIAIDYAHWLQNPDEILIHTLYVPSERTAVESVMAAKDVVYVSLLDNVRGRLAAYRFEDGGWTPSEIAMPQNGSLSIMDANAYSNAAMLTYKDFLTPDSLYWLTGDGSAPTVIKSLPPRFDAAPFKIEQFEATSKDGTLVPYFVVSPKDASGPLPTLMYGYGGFEISETPWYWATAGKMWLSRGGAFVVTNIRGGGEFGPRWHEAALKLNRQKSYDDFIAIAEDLIKRGITTPKQLGISGGSNGGLLVGVAFTQRPDLFNAVLCDVPLLDMIRYTELPPGASWIAEYGDPAIPEERAAIEAYSPYQNLKDGVTYPKVLFLTSTEDDRVNPAHARKMAALMASKNYPFLFYEETEGGHSAAANLKQRAMQLAMQYVYLHQQLGGH